MELGKKKKQKTRTYLQNISFDYFCYSFVTLEVFYFLLSEMVTKWIAPFYMDAYHTICKDLISFYTFIYLFKR